MSGEHNHGGHFWVRHVSIAHSRSACGATPFLHELAPWSRLPCQSQNCATHRMVPQVEDPICYLREAGGSRRRDRYLCVACRPHTRPQRLSPRRRELARAPQTHHTHRKPRHPTLASRSERECAPLQHAAHMTQAMSSFTSTHHVASNAHKAPRNAPGTLSRPSRAHSNAPIPAQ